MNDSGVPHGAGVSSSKVIIKVGYAWDEGQATATQQPWSHIRDFVKQCVAEATSRTSAECAIAEGGSIAKVARLRATAGRPLMERILEAVEEADILIFDLSPPPSRECECLNANVCIELGIALGNQKDIFLLRKCSLEVPSDVRGYYVTKYSDPQNGHLPLNADASLKAGLTACIIRCFRTKNGHQCFEAETEG